MSLNKISINDYFEKIDMIPPVKQFDEICSDNKKNIIQEHIHEISITNAIYNSLYFLALKSIAMVKCGFIEKFTNDNIMWSAFVKKYVFPIFYY